MKSKEARSRISFPTVIHLATFYKEYEGQKLPTREEIVKQLTMDKTKITTAHENTEVLSGSYRYVVETTDEEDSRTFAIRMVSKKQIWPRKISLKHSKRLAQQIQEYIDKLPIKPASIFNISIQPLKNVEDCVPIIQNYSKAFKRKVASSGIIKNCVLTTLKEEDTNYLRKDLFLFPLGRTAQEAYNSLGDLIDDMPLLASSAGRLVGLYRQRKGIFKQIDISERSTQEKISAILFDVQFKRRRMEPADLESILNGVNKIFSRLTVMSTAMRRDSVKARGFIRNIKSLLDSWKEKDLVNFPLTTVVEYSGYERKVSIFNDYLDRLDAITARASMVLDSVRTYVGIQQQKTSVEEQKYSRGLLNRMVNLQEILHKLEILIVAFYITEMGRLVFEAVAHEFVTLLTVAFIPFALLIAIGIRRLLHRPREA